ncbi:MAG: hypothetical protein A2W99_14340 [Bacteroidetes bacterium GWF2_33_16]|nr:MAG: hypothetical protein A2X00_06270 [Bacteroidetes bacterium GWE2_32_14]OFY04804.1 MAG: hypothetical protein A2W99_14340 [Bacteroidetes bacterium GWF2_33_16]
MKKLYTFISLLLIISTSLAQEKAKVLVSSDQNNQIIIKWYTETIYTENPVNIYRQEKNDLNWIKINTIPIVRKNQLSEKLKEQDPLFNIIENKILGSRAKDLDGITKFVIMIRSVEYPEFSEFLGIQFFDKDITLGKEYRYKINEIENTKESELGLSEWIVADKYIPKSAPDSLKVVQNDYSANFSWIPNEDLFMGVYLYRAINNAEKEKLTSVPIIASADEQGNYPEIFFTDDSLKIEESYSYEISGIDYFGRESKLSPKITFTIKDISPPPPPDKLITEVVGKNVRLYWENKNVPDLAGYYIYKTSMNDTAFKRINNTPIGKEYHTYTDSVKDIGVHNYKVSTIDESGNESFSEIYPAVINDIFPPAKPKLLIASADTGVIILSWQENTEPDLLGYYVYRTIDSDSKNYSLLNADPIKENRFINYLPREVKNNFLYRVIAIDSAYNKSDYSDFAITRIPDAIPPQKPVIKSISQEKKGLIVEWLPVFDLDLAGYQVYRAEKDKTPIQLNVNLIKGIELFTDRLALPNVDYNYFIIAVDSSGNLSEKSELYAAKLCIETEVNIDFRKITVEYKKKKQHVQISWEVKSDNEIKGYIVYRKTNEQENFKPISGLLPKPEFTDKNISAGKEYLYEIKAFTTDNKQVKSKTKKISIP